MHMLIHTLDYAPDVFYESPKSFSIGFKAAMTGLTHPDGPRLRLVGSYPTRPYPRFYPSSASR